MITKKCSQCGEEKPCTSEYWQKGAGLYGLCSKCKICRNQNEKKYRETHKEGRQKRVDENKQHLKEYQHTYKVKNKERLKEQRKQYYLSVKDSVLKKYRENNTPYLREKQQQRESIKKYRTLHSKTEWFIFKNKIKHDTCSICGSCGRIVAHHVDNSIWNKVVFCCYSCHQLIHNGAIECPEPIDLLNYDR